MTTAQQLGSQMKMARDKANMSARGLGQKVGVSPPTIAEYESGSSVPKADVLARIAEALGLPEVVVDGFRFTITRVELIEAGPRAEQLPLDLTGQYTFSKGTLRISPGRISVSFEGPAPPADQSRAS
jgi:transcriptional regulator with XRE-family HTH domain